MAVYSAALSWCSASHNVFSFSVSMIYHSTSTTSSSTAFIPTLCSQSSHEPQMVIIQSRVTFAKQLWHCAVEKQNLLEKMVYSLTLVSVLRCQCKVYDSSHWHFMAQNTKMFPREEIHAWQIVNHWYCVSWQLGSITISYHNYWHRILSWQVRKQVRY